MNRILCFLTGGHKYKDANLQTRFEGDNWIANNRCMKCGKLYEVQLSVNEILRGYELMEHMREGEE